MGAFRTAIDALLPTNYWDATDIRYSVGAGYSFSYSVVGVVRTLRLSTGETRSSLVKTETNPAHRGTIFASDMRGSWQISNDTNSADIDTGSFVFTGIFEPPTTGLVATPPQVGPDEFLGSDNRGPGYANSNGFFLVSLRDSTLARGWWDMHVMANGNIGIGTWSEFGWGDLMIADNRPTQTYITWNKRQVYVYDTGFPAKLLFDGRPHLVTVRFRAHNQSNANSNTPLPQDNWIKVTIDGTSLGTTSRGPALIGYSTVLDGATYAFDEAGAWNRILSDAEVASLWGTSVWGTAWPHPGAGFESVASATALTDSLLRIVDWPPAYPDINGPRAPQVITAQAATDGFDPVWVQEDTVGVAEADAVYERAQMGTGTWNVDPWSSSLDQEQADRWLDDQDIALLGAGIHGYSEMVGSLDQAQAQLVGTASGQSSVSGSLSLEVHLAAEEVHGSSTVYAITIGDLSTLAGSADGSSSVSGDLTRGSLTLAGTAAGSSVVSDAPLLVKRYSLIGGAEVDDNGMPVPVDGVRRGRFTPKSSGLVNKGNLVGS